MKKKVFIRPGFILVVLLCLFSCKIAKRTEAEKMVAEWVGKEIIFPKDIRCTYMGKDTVCPKMDAPYKILLYTDSTGCTSCKFHFYAWNTILKEVDSLGLGAINVLFYFHPKEENELQFLLKRDNFKRSIFLDETDRLNKLNNFPKKSEYQCFLLDDKNQILLIGNPTINPNLWSIYKQIIMGEKNGKDNEIKKTTVKIVQKDQEFSDMNINDTITRVFILQNIGDESLVINNVSSSCGCIFPEWDKSPIKPGDSTTINIKITPDSPGYFMKSINVYCNIEDEVFQLIIKGMVNNK